jgi:hypothetical protein
MYRQPSVRVLFAHVSHEPRKSGFPPPSSDEGGFILTGTGKNITDEYDNRGFAETAAVGHLMQAVVQLSAYAVNQEATRYETPVLSPSRLFLPGHEGLLAARGFLA